jgi:hypothetical protein
MDKIKKQTQSKKRLTTKTPRAPRTTKNNDVLKALNPRLIFDFLGALGVLVVKMFGFV